LVNTNSCPKGWLIGAEGARLLQEQWDR